MKFVIIFTISLRKTSKLVFFGSFFLPENDDSDGFNIGLFSALLSAFGQHFGLRSKQSLRPAVEFRQHHGSFDGEEVGSWVRMLIGMVDKADVMSGQGSEVKAFKDERKANYKFEHFFKNVVVDEEVVEFYKRMREKYGTEWIDEL